MSKKTFRGPFIRSSEVVRNPDIEWMNHPVNPWLCVSAAPHVEFSKPLHDVEVREKETAKFECEVSREDAKVSLQFVCPG